MICQGCGNSTATITRTWFTDQGMMEVCDKKDCGDLKTPWFPDVYFRQPEFVENLADEKHPFGQLVESPRHKARLLAAQGIREDGDRLRGSRDKGVRKREKSVTPEIKAKIDGAVKTAIRKFKQERGAPVGVPLKMVRRK